MLKQRNSYEHVAVFKKYIDAVLSYHYNKTCKLKFSRDKNRPSSAEVQSKVLTSSNPSKILKM